MKQKTYRTRTSICKRCSNSFMKRSKFNDLCEKCKKPIGWAAKRGKHEPRANIFANRK